MMKKKNNLLLAAFAGLLLAGCNTIDPANGLSVKSESTPFDGPSAKLTVQVGTTHTKTGIPVEEESVVDLQVLVFGPDGKLEAYGQNEASQLSLECTGGLKIVYAFVNTPSLADIRDTVELYRRPFSLSNLSEGTLPMKGQMKTVISGDANLTIWVERMVCKIILNTIRIASSESYPEARVEIDKMYLANAVNAINLNGEISQWANPLTFTEGCSPLMYDLYTQLPLSIVGSQSVNNVYYAMPNPTESDSFSDEWCPRHTRLVLSGSFYDGEILIRNGYYPIPIAGLKANNCYIIESYTITRPGLEQPYEDGFKLTEGITIRVADWEENEPINETL